MSVGVIIEHHVRPGSRDAVRAIWEEFLRPAITANAAHESYAYMYDVDDPQRDPRSTAVHRRETAAAFLAMPEYAACVAAVEHLLVGPPVVTRTEIIWTKER